MVVKSGTSQAEINAAASISTKNKLLVIGDSLINNGANPSYTDTTASYFAQNPRGWWHWVQAMAGHPFRHEIGWNGTQASGNRIGHNWGKGSDTTALILARQSEWLPKIDSNTLVIMNSITNDPTSLTVDQFAANVATFHALVKAKGAHLVWVGLSERNQVDGGGSAYWTTTARHKKAWAMDNVLREYAANNEGFSYFDISTGFIDPATGDLYTSSTADGLHFNQRLAYRQAEKFIRDFPQLIPSPKPLHAKSSFAVYDATDNIYGNLVSNGTMSGTGGTTSGNNITGTWANTWQAYMATAGGLSAEGSIITDPTPDGLRWQRIRLTSGTTADGSGTATFRLRWNAGTNITTGVATGEWYKLAFQARFTKPTVAGVEPIDSFYALLEDKSTGGWDTRWGVPFSNAGDKGLPEEDTGILYMETQPIQAVNTTGFDLDFFFVGGSATASSITFDVTGVNVIRLRTAPTYQ